MEARGDEIFSKRCAALDERMAQSLGHPLIGEARLLVHLAFYRVVALSQSRRISLAAAYEKILPALPAQEDFGVFYRLMVEAATQLSPQWEQDADKVVSLRSRRSRPRHVSPNKMRRLIAGAAR